MEQNLRLGLNQHGNVDAEEIVSLEKVVLEHEDVKAEIAKLKLPEGSVIICDPWTYGTYYTNANGAKLTNGRL